MPNVVQKTLPYGVNNMNAIRIVPRISLNKLGEYMAATPSRRKRIISDQKEPKSFITARYTVAQEVISDYIQDGMCDDDMLTDAINRLMTAPVSSEWEEQSNQLCAVAIEHFVNLKDRLDIDGCRCMVLSPEETATMAIAGVEVSIRPELSVTVQDGRKNGYLGLIKLAFSKTYKLGEKSGEYVATLLHEYASRALFNGQQVWNDKCIVVDIFDELIITAPSARKKRLEDIEAACEEIRRMW